MQHGSRAASNTDISGFEHLERDDRGVEQVPHFMSQEPRARIPSRILSIQSGLILLAAEFGDSTRNRVVQAPIEHAKVVRADRRVHLHRELGDRLTDVAVVVHDL